MTVNQETRQVLDSIKLAFQNLLGPLTHQVTGCKTHILLYAAQLTRCLTDMTLGLHIRKKQVIHLLLILTGRITAIKKADRIKTS